MAIIGLFYGSDTGNTETVAKNIQKSWGEDVVAIQDIAKTSQKDIEQYDFIIFGIPTWYYGEAQCDWDDFFPTLEKIDFTDKLVAIYGLGDQEDYADYFCDAIGTIADIISPRGAIIVGHWSTDGYDFTQSQGLVDDNTFVGLCLDEDRQPELSDERLAKWLIQIRDEMCIDQIIGS